MLYPASNAQQLLDYQDESIRIGGSVRPTTQTDSQELFLEVWKEMRAMALGYPRAMDQETLVV